MPQNAFPISQSVMRHTFPDVLANLAGEAPEAKVGAIVLESVPAVGKPLSYGDSDSASWRDSV
jgi:hypothetical protein